MRLPRVVVVFALGAAAAPPHAAAQSSARVSIIDNAFTPVVVEIRPGEGVTWMYDGATRPHTVSSQPASTEQWDSGQMDAITKPQFQRTFNTPGTYPYYCKVHGRDSPAADPPKDPKSQPCTMCGIVRVMAAATPSPTATPARTATPRLTRTAAPTRSPAAIATPTPPVESVTPSPSPTPTATATIAARAPRETGGGSAAPAAAAAALGALGVGGAGYVFWRRGRMR
jgi:plastocyanin